MRNLLPKNAQTKAQIKRHCFRTLVVQFPHSKSEILSHKLYSVAVQPGLCRTCSNTPKTSFVTSLRKVLWSNEPHH